MRLGRAAVAAVLVAAVAVVTLWLVGEERDVPADSTEAATSTPDATATSSPTPTVTASSPPAREKAARDAACDTGTGGVVPTRIALPGVTGRVEVVTPPRDANGVPGVPPLTEAGKTVFAWDREQGVEPGDPAGNVLLNAHTWPDGSALGNTLLDELHRGDRVVVLGDGKRLCYRVTERVEVLAEDGLPRYYETDGPPQLAVVVCSGRRLAPGVWEKRTVWFASPVRAG